MKHLLLGCALLTLAWPLAAPAAGTVVEAKLGTQVENRTLVGETATFAPGDRAYLWLKVEGAAGEVLTVTWKVGDLTFPVELEVGSSPWRTWASKTLHIAGEWTVTVADAAGTPMHETRFTVK